MALTSIGMNLATVSYYSTEEPFIDRFKTSGLWRANDAAGNLISDGSVGFDCHGNPVAFAGKISLTTSVEVDPIALPTTDQYVITWSGTATVAVSGSKILSQSAGTATFQVTKDVASVAITFKGVDSSNAIHDIHVVRADQVDLFKSGEIFNPDFVAKASSWDVLRFMDWGNTNDSSAVTWASRAQMSDGSWAANTHADGVPLEVMVKLANEAHTDMWWNVPTQADDTYVTNALALYPRPSRSQPQGPCRIFERGVEFGLRRFQLCQGPSQHVVGHRRQS